MTIYKKLICIVVLISFLIGSSCALANSEPAKESFIDNYKEGLWTLDDIEGDVIISSVNGEITHGDRLRIRIPIAGNCHLANVVTSFLTYNKNTDIKNIRDREGTAHFGVSPIKVNYLFSTKCQVLRPGTSPIASSLKSCAKPACFSFVAFMATHS